MQDKIFRKLNSFKTRPLSLIRCLLYGVKVRRN